MYTLREFQEVSSHKLAEKLGPMTLTTILLQPGGAEQLANPATAAGFLDAAIILLTSNGLSEDDIKQIIRNKWDEVPVIMERTKMMQERGKAHFKRMLANREKEKSLAWKVGTDIADSVLGPAPELATEPVDGPASPADVSDVEWPNKES